VHPADKVTINTGSSTAMAACTRTAGDRPRMSGKGTTRTLASPITVSPATSLAVTQEEARSVPGSGWISKERSTGAPNTTTPLLPPKDSAEAPAATAHRLVPKMALRIFTICSVFGATHSCT